jgi:hypothetical protein
MTEHRDRSFGRCMISSTRHKVPLVGIAAMVILGACGGSGPKKADPAADLAAAKAAVLTAADLPGYTATPSTPGGDLPKSATQRFAKCLNLPTTIFDDTPGAQTADSPDFDKASAEVSSEVEIDPTRADIDQGWSQFSKATVERCLGGLFDDSLRGSVPGASFGKVNVTRFEPQIGNRSVGYQVTIPVTKDGQNFPLYIDFLFVARDRGGITLSGANANQPFDRATEIALTRKMYDRVGNHAR